MSTLVHTFLLTGLVVAGIAFVVALGLLPILVANRRKHPNKEAITVCCIVGWLVWPAWVVALVWAYTNKVAVATTEPQAFPVRSIPPK